MLRNSELLRLTKFARDLITHSEFEWGFTVICAPFVCQLWSESAKGLYKINKSKTVRKL